MKKKIYWYKVTCIHPGWHKKYYCVYEHFPYLLKKKDDLWSFWQSIFVTEAKNIANPDTKEDKDIEWDVKLVRKVPKKVIKEKIKMHEKEISILRATKSINNRRKNEKGKRTNRP
jgi:hypothetical protein